MLKYRYRGLPDGCAVPFSSISGISSTWLAWSMELPTSRRADTPLPADWICEKIRKATMTAIRALARDMAPV